MSIEQQVLEEEYTLMLELLTERSSASSFDVEDIEQEYNYLLVYQGQDWGGRGEIKNAEIQGHIWAYEVFLKRWRENNPKD